MPIVRDAGDTEFAYVVGRGSRVPKELEGFVYEGSHRIPFLRSDIELQVATYRLPG